MKPKMELEDLTIEKIHQGLIKKEFSAVEICRTFLERIEKEDKKIRSFLTISEKLALAQAEEVDEMIFSGREIPILAGVPCAIKDNILVEGVECTAGSKILAPHYFKKNKNKPQNGKIYIAPYDATVIRRLKDQKAIILGKTNLDEFAMGSSTENSAFFPSKNPYDLNRVPGGSSGGSAAAVAANFAVFALGSDTGGSIRQPASFCGIVGLKPTYGVVSRYGLIAFASSLDQIGPMAKNIQDCQNVFNVIRGRDEMDSTSVEFRRSDFQLRIKDLKIGVPKEYLIRGLDEEVERIIKEAIKKYEEMGAKIEEISLPHTEYALPCYYIIAPAEASANLARYDGIKYGYSKHQSSKKQDQSLLDVYLESRSEGFGPEVRRRIMLGTYVLSSGYYEAYYLRAQKVRTKIKEDFEKAFKVVDAIFTPVSPTPAFKLGEKINDPLKMYLSDIFTISVNLAGLPALSLPCGKTKEGLPVGLQIIGEAFGEEKIFQIAQIYGD